MDVLNTINELCTAQQFQEAIDLAAQELDQAAVPVVLNALYETYCVDVEATLDIDALVAVFDAWQAALPFSPAMNRFEYCTADWASNCGFIALRIADKDFAGAIYGCRELAAEHPEFAAVGFYGWVLHNFLEAEKHSEAPTIKGINDCLDLYLELNMPKPSRVHSELLNQVVELSAILPINAYKFIYQWGWQHFRAEDLKGAEASLFVRAVARYAHLLHQKLSKYESNASVFILLQKDVQQFFPMLQATASEYPQNEDLLHGVSLLAHL